MELVQKAFGLLEPFIVLGGLYDAEGVDVKPSVRLGAVPPTLPLPTSP